MTTATFAETLEHTERATGDDAATANLLRESDGEQAFRRPRPISESLVTRAADMMAEAMTLPGFRGQRARLNLMEAFTTSDFQWAAWIQLERETISQYTEQTPSFQNWVDTTRVRDFRKKELVDFTQTPFTLERVPELAPYPAQDRSGGFKQDIQAVKYGRRYSLSWESMINDQLDELADIPNALASAAREAEIFNALSLLLNMTGPQVASGPNTGFFKNYTGGYSSSNPFAGVNTTPATVPLTYDNLLGAINTIRARRNPQTKRPIVLPGKFQLVVPLELQAAAENILATDFREVTSGGVMTRIANEVRSSVDLRVEPWLSYVDGHAKAPTTWYLLPPRGSQFKALVTASLIGHETPELRVKADAGRSIGGGEINPQDGSFVMDDVQYRVRHVMGGATLNPMATYVSLGS